MAGGAAGAGLHPGALRGQVDRCDVLRLFFGRAARHGGSHHARADADVRHCARDGAGHGGLYPEFGAKLATIVLSAVLILELIGPHRGAVRPQARRRTSEET